MSGMRSKWRSLSLRLILFLLPVGDVLRAQAILTWTSGDILHATTGLGGILGTPLLSNAFTINITTSANHTFDGRAVINDTTTNWSGGSLLASQGATFTNNGTLNDTSTGTMGSSGAGGLTMTFTNASGGIYNLQIAGTKNINAAFTNDGTVNVDGGILAFNSGGASSGTIATDATMTTRFAGGDFSVPDASKLTGAGTYELTGGTLSLTGALGGTFNQSGGILAGTHTLTGTVGWTGGTWSSTGTTTLTGTLNITGGGNHFFDARSVINDGTLNWSEGNLLASQGATLTNNGVFNGSSASSIGSSGNGGAVVTFTNSASGSYNKNGTSTTNLNTVFTNAGTLNVNQGLLVLNSGGSSAGAIDVDAGATIRFAGSSTFTVPDASKLLGAGTYELTGGTLAVTGTSGTSVFNQSGGTLAGTHAFDGTFGWTGGTWSSTGTTTIEGTLAISGTGNRFFDARAVINDGTVNWSGGNLLASQGATFTNNATFNDTSAGTMGSSGNGGGTMTFTNAAGGFYHKQSAGTKDTNVAFTNAGTLNVDAGILNFNGGGSSTGLIAADAGTTVRFSGGTFAVPDATKLTGPGHYELTGGTLVLTGAHAVPTFTQTGGTLAGSPTLPNTYHWSAGNWNGAGTTTVTGTLSIATSVNHNLDSRAVINEGTVNWSAGNLLGSLGATFTNAGTFNDSSTGTFGSSGAGGTTLIFTNAAGGIFNKQSAGVKDVNVNFINAGTLNVDAGTLRFDAGGTNSAGGTIAADAGTTVQFANNFTFARRRVRGPRRVPPEWRNLHRQRHDYGRFQPDRRHPGGLANLHRHARLVGRHVERGRERLHHDDC